MWVVFLALASMACATFFESTGRPDRTLFWYGATYSPLIFYELWHARRCGELGSLFRPRWGDFALGSVSTYLLLGLFVAAALAFAPFNSENWVRWSGPAAYWAQDPCTPTQGSIMLPLCIWVGTFEEIVWRRMVPRALGRKLKPRTASVLSNIAYPLGYVPMLFVRGQGSEVILVAVALSGLVWALLTQKTGRIAPAAISHGLLLWLLTRHSLVLFGGYCGRVP